MHEDHRKRVRERFLSEGLDGFAPHNVLEFLLFYSIPRRDTNEIAHALLDKFGGLSQVFDADINELAEVNGIGINSAVLIKLIPQLAKRYMTDSVRPEDGKFNRASKIGDYFVSRFIGETTEVVYMMLLDSSYSLINCRRIFEGSVNSAHLPTRTVISEALSTKASMVVLAHNHPGGLAVPSSNDINTTRCLSDALGLIDAKLLEHYVIAGSRYAMIMSMQTDIIRQTFTTDEISGFYDTSAPEIVEANLPK